MSDTITMECNCCRIETDCINGLCEWCSGYNYQLKQRIAELEEKHRWIPISEGPPEKNARYWVTDNVTAWISHFSTYTGVFSFEKFLITHWKPITLPKGE